MHVAYDIIMLKVIWWTLHVQVQMLFHDHGMQFWTSSSTTSYKDLQAQAAFRTAVGQGGEKNPKGGGKLFHDHGMQFFDWKSDQLPVMLPPAPEPGDCWSS